MSRALLIVGAGSIIVRHMLRSYFLSVRFVAGLLVGMMTLAVAGCAFETRAPVPAFRVLVVASSDPDHDAMISQAKSFLEKIAADNDFDKSPRPNVRVLARADESTYKPNKPMGDHPMIWANEEYDRALYIGIGHDVTAWGDPHFAVLMRDAMLWAADRTDSKP